MSCGLREQTLTALRDAAQGNISKAKVTVEVYLHNPVGIGEHPNLIGAIQEQLDIIAHAEEQIAIVDKYFATHSCTDNEEWTA